MALTLAEKILQAHIVKEACPDTEFVPGTPIRRGADIAIFTRQKADTMIFCADENRPHKKEKTAVQAVFWCSIGESNSGHHD